MSVNGDPSNVCNELIMGILVCPSSGDPSVCVNGDPSVCVNGHPTNASVNGDPSEPQ